MATRFSYDNCSQIPGPLKPYGDIAGLGVVIGFAASAWLTVLILVAYYAFAFDPLADPFEGTGRRNKQNKPPYISNPMDLLLARYTKYLRRHQDHEGHSIENAFHKCMLSLSDAQLITGISILVSGFWSLKHGPGLTAYHWRMVVSLAWFSSVTHLSALTFLRTYLAKHPTGRLWRLALMSILLILLFAAVIPTGHFEFLGHEHGTARFIDLGKAIYPTDCHDFQVNKSRYYPSLEHRRNLTLAAELVRNGTIGPKDCKILDKPVLPFDITNAASNLDILRYMSITDVFVDNQEVVIFFESPAACFFKGGMRKSTTAFVSMISSLLLLVYSYLIRVVKIFEGPSQLMSQRTHGVLDRRYRALLIKWEQWFTTRKSGALVVLGIIFLPLQASIYCTFRLFLHLFTSTFAEVFSVILSAIWGTMNIVIIKGLADSETLGENDWAFGQVISLALLSSSFLPIAELLFKSFFINSNQRDNAMQNRPLLCRPSITSGPSEAALEVESSSGHSSCTGDVRLQHLSLNSETVGITTIEASATIIQNEPVTLGSGTMSCELIQDSDFRNRSTNLENQIADRLTESATAYDEIWIASVLFIMCGPLIIVILALLPATRSWMTMSSQPYDYLFNCFKIIAFLAVFVQQLIYFRLYLNRLSNSKIRRAIWTILVIAGSTSAIFLSIIVTFGWDSYIIAAFVLAGHFLSVIVGLFDFCWHMIRARSASLESIS